MKFSTYLSALSLLLVAAGALAQPVYRHVDGNGKVSFSDQPPSADARPAAPRPGISPNANAELPYELRQIVQRYPVTLYTGDECGACSAGRSLLITRGVPFDERTIKSNADIDALQRLSGQNSLPLLAIGSQQLRGFSDAEWSQYLDAAGYPKSTQLPASYRNPPAQPLVAQQPAARPAAAATPAPAAPGPAAAPAAATGPTPGNPAGIKF
ncbi:glutaredoxin family protein [Variovorax sp. PBL-E5]|uniref:glutaredoxin family protein n=1 Tax=Variovorax sp. PBL-E5 TaxID=434014 RepID=UPI001318033A|nr:glutaredoxin family protein [Variovorax sp. PBL-E5]VTU25455.1 glutaredoxin-like protein, YruB-family [Variovorax sp. PBL-E5]